MDLQDGISPLLANNSFKEGVITAYLSLKKNEQCLIEDEI